MRFPLTLDIAISDNYDDENADLAYGTAGLRFEEIKKLLEEKYPTAVVELVEGPIELGEEVKRS
jgi:hypothetical protein